jgi:CRP-like cAMP-binding protein
MDEQPKILTIANEPAMAPLDLLAGAPFFAGLTRLQLQRVAAVSVLHQYDKDAHIYRTGEVAQHLYVLGHGMVRFAVGLGGRHNPGSDILHRHEVFGWAAMTPSDNIRIANATCLTPCSVLAINGRELIGLMEQDQQMGYQIMKQLVRLITGTFTASVAG